MWVETIDGNYLNLDQAQKVFAADQGDGVVLIIATVGGSEGVLQTSSVFATVADAQAAIRAIVSGTTLTN